METGYFINHGNLYKLGSFVKGYGAEYQPGNPDLLYANIILQYDAETAAFKLINVKAAPWVTNVNTRGLALEPLDKILTKVFNSLASSKADTKIIADVRSRINKMKGVRATPKIKMTPEDPNTPTDDSIKQISASQTGIDHIIDDLDALIQILLLETNYHPSEPEIKTTALTTLLNDIIEKNKAVIDAFPDLDNARIARNKLMFADGGSFELASKVKKYVLSVYGGKSKQYHQVASLKFTKPKK
jgi:hypothetical protein